VNVGFTVQAGEVLYLAVTRNAHSLGQLNFVHALIDLQRRAAAHKLSGDETQGATIGFSSMARWKVARHIPVLAPMTALMVAHTQDHQGQSVLGATYDHRVLHGADVAALLRRMTLAPATGESA
jgi:pyruvate/2-oxoglutarate dehydrogenase complex dihydrolipoamide acyltransferase (E2) component